MTNKLILHMIQLFLIFLIFWTMGNILVNAKKHRINLKEKFWTGLWIGYVTDLLDTLGIGTFATSTALFKATKLVEDDKKIPATLSTAHIIPVLIEALCFITIVEVNLTTLFVMAMASFLGAFVGTRITKNWNTRQVQRVLGILLIVAAFIMFYRLIANPGASISESAHGLYGIWILVGAMFNFTIGILMTMGLGNYAPELIFFSMLGINPSVALPVMMLDAAVIMSASTTDFIKSGRVNWPGVLGIIIGGSFGVLTAAFFLSKLDINHFKILIVFIALFTGTSLLRSSAIKR
ncbi:MULTISPECIES: sulfite exporter TauE/SafE family protein [Streptococcus]|uniref:Probable membrane transporter protein n=1 Tax=Streptococcus macedonicus TaxID=59310 RepID=A0AA47ILJ9_STRMC|nr:MULTISPECIES: sulfite exporter TauE/SafE family protein [Streptococcus]ALT81801.1 sodium:solute symporter [Streptococcus gallolyticus]MBF6976740.1 sulfite exporter TauE/SafE family protein [Streptococcus macedonicus]MCW8487095.1 sulfite exporter TauE/SafE family protein [Streptococcus macedonicus]MCW8495318.1 sulfite exporter TauE/SafE family protein [Streptococcus macedonicus]MCW8500576.1 sulfite exporter TauE/SafE family protein [Streptococcus macedonicus]